MLLTILLSVMMMLGLFLMLWGGVGFIQDKRFFSSAPKEVQNVVPETKPERFSDVISKEEQKQYVLKTLGI